MKKAYSPNLLGIYKAQEITNNNIGVNFLESYKKKKYKQKTMSVAMLIVFIFNMSMITNLAMISPTLACHGNISIIKKTNTDTNEKFSFSGDLGIFELGQNDQKISEHQPGDKTYIIKEEETAGWDLENISCTGDTNDNTTVDLANNRVLISLDNAETIVCTFYNEEIITEPVCGDGIIEGEEICDAGELNNDVCEANYNDTCSYCNDVCELTEVVGGFCGDGIVNGEEECDFNNQDSNINCDSNCEIVEEDYCGDNIINNDEICDNGSNNGLVCSPIYGGECSYCSLECTEIIVKGQNCGDSEINGEEECDDGLNNGNACNPLYGETCNYCNSTCAIENLVGPYCGDAILQDNEECDGDLGIDANQICSETCTIINIEHCGDGIINTDEECDLGQAINGLICNANYGETCSYCSNNCSNITVEGPSCGDEIINGDEECDGDTGINEHESCSETCEIIIEEYCGDGIINGEETCDDRNITNGDGCDANCQIEENHEPVCGNNIIESGETCDDGSNNGQEGYCNTNCKSTTAPSGGGGTPLCILQNTCGQLKQPEEVLVLAETGAPYLDIEKIVKQKYAKAGDTEIEYTIFLGNNGNLTAFNVQISDKLPDGMFFSENGSSSKTWDIGDMPSGDIESIDYTVYLSDTIDSDSLVNTAIAIADNHDPVTAQAKLIIKKSEVIEKVAPILPVTGFSPQEMLILSFLAMFSFGSVAKLKKYQNTI